MVLGQQNEPLLVPQPVPYLIRRKIQVLLLLKQSATAGSCISEIQEDYKRCYGEEIFPQEFGYSSWVNLLRSMDEVEVLTRNKSFVKAKPLPRDLAVGGLREVFRPGGRYVRQFIDNNPAAGTEQGNGNQMRETISPDSTSQPPDVSFAEADNTPSGTRTVSEVQSNTNSSSAVVQGTSGEVLQRSQETQAATERHGTAGAAPEDEDSDDEIQFLCEKSPKRRRADPKDVKPSTSELQKAASASESAPRDQAGSERDEKPPAAVLFASSSSSSADSRQGDAAGPRDSLVDQATKETNHATPGFSGGISSGTLNSHENTASGEQDVKPPRNLTLEASAAVAPTADTEASNNVSVKEEPSESSPDEKMWPKIKTEIKVEIKEEIKKEIKAEVKEEVKSEPKSLSDDDLLDSDDGSDTFIPAGDEEEMLRSLESSPAPPEAMEEANPVAVPTVETEEESCSSKVTDVLQEKAPASRPNNPEVPGTAQGVIPTPAEVLKVVGNAPSAEVATCEMDAAGPSNTEVIVSSPKSPDSQESASQDSQFVSRWIDPQLMSTAAETAQSSSSNVPTSQEAHADPIEMESDDLTMNFPDVEPAPAMVEDMQIPSNPVQPSVLRPVQQETVSKILSGSQMQSSQKSPVQSSSKPQSQNANPGPTKVTPAPAAPVRSNASAVTRKSPPSKPQPKGPTAQKRPNPNPSPGPSSAGQSKRSKNDTPATGSPSKSTEGAWFKGDHRKIENSLFFMTTIRRCPPKDYLRANKDHFYYGKGTKTVCLVELMDIREQWRLKPSLMRFHPFYRSPSNESGSTSNGDSEGALQFTSFAPNCRTEADREILKMSPESIQLMELDAVLNFEIYIHGLQGTLTYVCSYGRFEDYFMKKYGDKANGFGYIPFHCEGVSKFSEENRSLGFIPYIGDASVNIFDPSSKSDFEEFVRSNTVANSVDIFVANGMSYDEEATFRSQDLCLGHLEIALKLLRQGGMFVLKLEDTITKLGVCFIRLLSFYFEEIFIHKPLSAMPGERFVVCRGKRGNVKPEAKQVLKDCCEFITQQIYDQGGEEISKFFTLDSAHEFFEVEDAEFLRYIRNQNKKIGDGEISDWLYYMERSKGVGYKSMQDYMKEIADRRQSLWNKWNSMNHLDAIVRGMQRNLSTSVGNSGSGDQADEVLLYEDLVDESIAELGEEPLAEVDTVADQVDFEATAGPSSASVVPTDGPQAVWNQSVTSPSDTGVMLDRGEKSIVSTTRGYSKPRGFVDQWRAVMSTGAKNRFVIVACADGSYKYCVKSKSWELVKGLQLIKSTVIYAEIFHSSEGQTLSIIDAAKLGSEDIRSLSFEQRRRKCADFASLVDVPFNTDWRVVVVESFPLERLSAEMQKLCANDKKWRVRSSQNRFSASVSTGDSQKLVEFEPKEVLLLPTKTVTCLAPGAATSGDGQDDSTNFKSVMRDRLFWEWNPRAKLPSITKELAEELKTKECLNLFLYMATNAKN